jgi:hypothetical protein
MPPSRRAAGRRGCISSAYRRDVFPIFDDYSFFPDITVAEHPDLLAGMYDVPDNEATAAAALARFGVSGVTERFPTGRRTSRRWPGNYKELASRGCPFVWMKRPSFSRIFPGQKGIRVSDPFPDLFQRCIQR